MKVTEIKIRKIEKEGKAKAFVDVILDGCLAIHSLRIIEGKDRLFVAFPSKKVGENFYDICHPTTSELRSEIETAILNEYNKGE